MIDDDRAAIGTRDRTQLRTMVSEITSATKWKKVAHARECA